MVFQLASKLEPLQPKNMGGYFDLNIPYIESDRHVSTSDKPSLRSRRLKQALMAMELGYTGVAYNRTLKGVMSESHRCATALFPISKLNTATANPTSSSSFCAAVKFHRDLLGVHVSSPFRQYTRLTVTVDAPSQLSALNAGNPILRSYDVVAVRPMSQVAFDQACQTSEVDMIAIDFSEKLPFRVKQPMVKAAIKRGVYFEITYSGLIADAQSRRQMISNCKLLVDWTRGKNLIISGAASSATELRGPLDVANLFFLLGLSMERARAAISKNCRSLLANALRKRHFYKEAVKVEEIPSGGVNIEQPLFDDWLKFDPISSGEGDLFLDDMEKSFLLSNTTNETAKVIDFTSTMNGLPAHGLQIKDLISMTKTSMGTEGADAGSEKPEEQDGLNHAGTFTNSVETVSISIEKPKYSNDSEQNHVASQTQIIESQIYVANALPDDERVQSTIIEAACTPSSHHHASVEITDHLNKSSISGLQLEEPYMENRCDIGICTQEGVEESDRRTLDNIDSEDKNKPSMASSHATSEGIHAEGEKNGQMTVSPVVGFLNPATNLSEQPSEDIMGDNKQMDFAISYHGTDKPLAVAGRERRQRNASHRPTFSPFNRFLNPRAFKRKSRKLKTFSM